MASEEGENVEIKTHKVSGRRDFWKRWRTEEPTEVISNPQDISADDWLPPVEPSELREKRIRKAQQEAGVGTFTSRTAAGMDRREEKAEEVGEEAVKRQAKDLSSENSETSES